MPLRLERQLRALNTIAPLRRRPVLHDAEEPTVEIEDEVVALVRAEGRSTRYPRRTSAAISMRSPTSTGWGSAVRRGGGSR